MKKVSVSIWLLTGILVSSNLAGAAESDTDRLIDFLTDKGVIKKEDAAGLRADIAIKKQEEGQPPIIKAGKEGFILESANGDFKFKLGGYIQADGRFFQNDDNNTNAKNEDTDPRKVAATDQFYLRRVRPVFEGTVYRYFDFRLMPDFGNGKTELQDAYLDINYIPELRLRAGKFKAPVGLERLQSATNILFVERALPTNLVPNRDIGVQLHGDLANGAVNYAVGVFDGAPDGGSLDNDTNDQKEIDARIFLRPFKDAGIEPLTGLGFGVSGTTGISKGDIKSPNLPVYKTAGQTTFFSYLSNSTATSYNTAISNGNHYRISPQGYYYWGPFGVIGEYVISVQDVSIVSQNKSKARPSPARNSRLQNTAWQVAASYVLTGENASYSGVVPKSSWGALEIAGRYSELNIDEGAFRRFADPQKSARKASAWAGGLNWYLNKNVKAMLDYEVTKFTGGAVNPHSKKSAVDRDEERVVMSRLQIVF